MFDAATITRECSQAAGDDVAFASDEELLAAEVELRAARSAFEVAEAHVLGELRVRGVTDRCFGLKTPQWVASQAKVDRRPIARLAHLGVRLRQLPVVDAAVVEGSMSMDHASVLAEAAANPRVGDQVAATQSLWVEKAAGTSFADWKHQVEQTVVLLDQDGGYDPAKDRDRLRARFTTFDEGLTRLTADLVGADALAVRELVEAQADREFHRLKNDVARTSDLPMPGRATLLAMALVELVRRGSVVDQEHTTGPVVDVTLIIEATERTPLTDLPSTSGDAADGFEVFDPYRPVDWVGNAVANPLEECCGPAETPHDHHVHPAVTEMLLCDPVITALIVDSLGVPLDMGREIRLANRRQRRALANRDGGCIFPGCDCPADWCDAHHVIWWNDDGPTDMSNLALLCRYHHGVTHRRGWTMTATGDEWFSWTTPSGDTLHSQRHRGRSPTDHPALHLCPA